MDSNQNRLLLCAIVALVSVQLTEAQQVSATQTPTAPQLVRVNGTLSLQCRTGSDSYSLMWYRNRRASGGVSAGLEPLSFSYASSSEADVSDAPKDVEGRVESKRSGSELSLHLSDVRPGDSGLYYCAARDAQRRVGTARLYRNSDTC